MTTPTTTVYGGETFVLVGDVVNLMEGTNTVPLPLSVPVFWDAKSIMLEANSTLYVNNTPYPLLAATSAPQSTSSVGVSTTSDTGSSISTTTDTATASSTGASISTTADTTIVQATGTSKSSHTVPVASATTTASKTPKPAKSGVSDGAAAGIGVGCLLAGALIAGLVVWLLMRRSKNKSQSGFQDNGTAAHAGHEKQPILGPLSKVSSDSTLRTVENNLPLPLEDNAISGDITKLSTLIKNHVQSYYHESSVAPGMVDLDALQGLGDNLPVSIGTLGTLLSNPTTRETGLRFCIAWVIVSRIKFNGDPTTTLLPPEVVQCMLSMTALDGKPQVREAFLRNWRVITGELMQTSYLRNAYTPQDARNHNIFQATEVLEAILAPFAVTRTDHSARRRNLEEIIKRAATFAFALFSQPSSWRLDWPDSRSMEPGSLVIFPALEQLSDEEGRVFSPPRVFSEMIVRQIDG